MDDGIRELVRMVVDFARKAELTNEEEAELLELVAAAWRAGVKAADEVTGAAFTKAWLQ